MRKNIINQQFGELLVKSVHSKTRNGHVRYTCLCSCGSFANILGTHLIQGNTKSCGCKVPIGKSHKMWQGVGELPGDYWYNHVVRSAIGAKGRRNEVSLTITKEYAWELFLKQNRKCALSNLELYFPIKAKDKSYNVSLDRIDSSKGYDEGNVQWVHKDINIMKNKFENKYFIEMCKLITNNTV